MRVSLNWLKEFVDIEAAPEELARALTMLGLEIEAIERPGAEIDQVLVGEILSIKPHPDADKLVVCETAVGDGAPLQIVCGAANMQVGDRTPTAVVGATLPGGFKIARRKMRGLESQGMMCSARELGLGEDHEGLLILPPDTPVGMDARKALGLDDVIFEIEVTPNRNDWSSMLGVARELAALWDKPLRFPDRIPTEGKTAVSSLASVAIEAPEACPRYIGRVITGVQVGPSPQWLCARLLAAGQRPINNVVDVTNYILLETGQPMHAFDFAKLAERRIVVRNAAPGETIETLDGEKRALTPEMLVIADAEKPVALAGIMGGANSEVGEGTADLFLESAFFDPACVRRTARQLGIVTESSQRFQRGADPEMALTAIDRAAALILEVAGGSLAAGRLDEHPRPAPRREIALRYARTRRLLGTETPPEGQRHILEKLGFETLSHDAEGCRVTVPSWRHDATQEADLIEEIARLYGYDNLAVSLPRVRPSEHVHAPAEARLRELRHFLAGSGLTEMFHWSFSSEAALRKAGLDEAAARLVPLQNPLSEKHAAMRNTLLPGLLERAAWNLNRGVTDIAAFETGPVYLPAADGETMTLQQTRVGVVLSGRRAPQHWSGASGEADFYDIKGWAEAILAHCGAEARFEPCDLALYQHGQAAEVRLGNETIGGFGKVGPAALKAHGIDQPVYLLEIALDALLAQPRTHARFAPIPSFPPSLRDMAVIVDLAEPAGAIQQSAREAGGKLLKAVDIFDVYTGKQVPAGKKSVALSLVFQSSERTLTDADTQKAWDKILKRLETGHGAALR